jgi:hypothetical protein
VHAHCSAAPHIHKDFSVPKGGRNCPNGPTVAEKCDEKNSSWKEKPNNSNNNTGKQQHIPSWSQSQLGEAVYSVMTQRMRFTQASSRFGIPKGTLYDNILGKSRRMRALEEVGLTVVQEADVLQFCCDVSVMPYNRRTGKSLSHVVALVREMTGMHLAVRKSFRWWWAFCKKHSVISLHYDSGRKMRAFDPDGTDLDRDTFEDLLLHKNNNSNLAPINFSCKKEGGMMRN